MSFRDEGVSQLEVQTLIDARAPFPTNGQLSGVEPTRASKASGYDLPMVYASRDSELGWGVWQQSLWGVGYSYFQMGAGAPGLYEVSATVCWAASPNAGERYAQVVQQSNPIAGNYPANVLRRVCATNAFPGAGGRCVLNLHGFTRLSGTPFESLCVYVYQSSGVAIALEDPFGESSFFVRLVDPDPAKP